jgi:hypothetical protein
MRTLFRLCLLAVCAATLSQRALAFPPAPPHTLYGVVRDQIGNPLGNGAEVIFEASSGVRLRALVQAQVDSSLNYQIQIPMDAGLTSDLYSPTASMPAAPFRLRVRVGQTTFLPIEMTGDLSKLGQAGGSTRIDLTLGVDADGNGLPDSWEKAVAAFLGRLWQPGQIRPGDEYPGTGMTYRDVYLAGTYAMDPKEGFALQISNPGGATPKLAFTVVKGRSYTVQAAEVFGQWSPVSFRAIPIQPNAAAVTSFHATQTQRIEIEVSDSADVPYRFYRLIVQ